MSGGNYSTDLCPHCGYNLKRDEVIERDGFTLDPRGAVSYKGQHLRLAPSGAAILHTLAKAGGRAIPLSSLGERIAKNETDDPARLARVQTRHLRRKLEKYGAPDVVALVWGLGYAWRSPA